MTTPQKHLQTARTIAHLLDSQFSVLGFRFGLDPILDVFPILGDILPAFLSLYIVWIGLQVRLPQHEIIRMLLNILVDMGVGAVPLVGPVADAFFKSNERNIRILEKYLNTIEEGVVIS